MQKTITKHMIKIPSKIQSYYLGFNWRLPTYIVAMILNWPGLLLVDWLVGLLGSQPK